MAMKNGARFYCLMFGGIFFLASVLHLVRFARERDDIWWTPNTVPLSLVESRDRVEISIRGAQLEDILESGRLQLLGGTEPTRVTSADIGVRINNRDRVTAQRLPILLSASAGAGFAGLVLLLGLFNLVPSVRAGQTQ